MKKYTDPKLEVIVFDIENEIMNEEGGYDPGDVGQDPFGDLFPSDTDTPNSGNALNF